MNKNISIVVAGIALGLALAGCGGSSSSTSSTIPTVQAVASQIGATSVQTMSPTLYASQEANATWHGQQIDLATFANNQLRDNWLKVAQQFAGLATEGNDYAAVYTSGT